MHRRTVAPEEPVLEEEECTVAPSHRRAPKGGGGVLRSGDKDPPSCRGRIQGGGAICVLDDVWIGEWGLT